MRASVIPTSILSVCLAGMGQAAAGVPQDPHSYSEPDKVRVEHLVLDLDLDFERRIIHGEVELRLERLDPGAEELVLDTRALDIASVERKGPDRWHRAAFELGEADAHLGRPLRIPLEPRTERVRIRYRTTEGASGLQWLAPEQTGGGEHPFLFSQSQAIHARSWVPLQDSPQVRITYEARVRVPAGMMAVMSAENPKERAPDGIYRFSMPQPIPAYLMAIAAGDLVFQPMGERTGVYAEPGIVEAAAREFEDTEEMLEITEALYGPYDWGRYDLLILPPSFPFGGMENPRLSFITPTVIAGDKSLVSLIAHELAHSWSGNRVTNATWRDLWLNEGFTSYLDNRIMEAVFGEDRASMEAALARQDLVAEMEQLLPQDQALAVDLRGRDPDAVFTGVPYTKGQLMLMSMERRYGRDVFDAFLKSYFEAFAFQSLTTETFVDYAEAHLLAEYPGVMSSAELKEWIYAPGLPESGHVPVSDAFQTVAALRGSWLEGERTAESLPTTDWTVHEWLHFLNNLPQGLGTERMAELDAAFDLTASENAEIAHAWLKLAIQADYRPAFERLEAYLVGIGRNKLVVPLYEALAATDENRSFAEDVYARARPGYHPLTRSRVEALFDDTGG